MPVGQLVNLSWEDTVILFQQQSTLKTLQTPMLCVLQFCCCCSGCSFALVVTGWFVVLFLLFLCLFGDFFKNQFFWKADVVRSYFYCGENCKTCSLLSIYKTLENKYFFYVVNNLSSSFVHNAPADQYLTFSFVINRASIN